MFQRGCLKSPRQPLFIRLGNGERGQIRDSQSLQKPFETRSFFVCAGTNHDMEWGLPSRGKPVFLLFSACTLYGKKMLNLVAMLLRKIRSGTCITLLFAYVF